MVITISLIRARSAFKVLDIDYIPNIPNADIAKRCSHALSCIRHLYTDHLYRDDQDATIIIPYMTGLTSVCLHFHWYYYIPLLTQYCHKLSKINHFSSHCTVYDILPLFRVNSLLQELTYHICDLTDTILIELIHTCPHIHILCIPFENDITDIGILALSENCSQLKRLDISHCKQITEVAVLQLLQRCRKITALYVSTSSLSEETWTQLDRYIQKRVVRF